MGEKEATIHLKTKQHVVDEFNKISNERYGMKPSDMHRLILEAFIDDRLTIHPNETQLNLFDLMDSKEKE